MASKTNARRLNYAIAKAISGMKPPENLTVTEWADKKRRLSPESSAEPGPWRTYRTPYPGPGCIHRPEGSFNGRFPR